MCASPSPSASTVSPAPPPLSSLTLPRVIYRHTPHQLIVTPLKITLSAISSASSAESDGSSSFLIEHVFAAHPDSETVTTEESSVTESESGFGFGVTVWVLDIDRVRRGEVGRAGLQVTETEFDGSILRSVRISVSTRAEESVLASYIQEVAILGSGSDPLVTDADAVDSTGKEVLFVGETVSVERTGGRGAEVMVMDEEDDTGTGAGAATRRRRVEEVRIVMMSEDMERELYVRTRLGVVKEETERVEEEEEEGELDAKDDGDSDVCSVRLLGKTARRTLVVLNPVAGTGKGRRILESLVRPILERSHLQFDVIETEAPRHATTIASEVDPEKYTDVCLIGGDGTVWEFLQGIVGNGRFSASELRGFPIGIIPLGTGNGTSWSTGAMMNPLIAAFIVARGKTVPLDGMSVFHDGKRHCCVLQLSYAAIADADCGCMCLNCCGDGRFIITALGVVIRNQSYGVTLKYVEEAEALEKPCPSTCYVRRNSESQSDIGTSQFPPTPLLEKYFPDDLQGILDGEDRVSPQIEGVEIFEGPAFVLSFTNQCKVASDFWTSPRQHPSSGSVDIVMIRPVNRCQLIASLAHMLQAEPEGILGDQNFEFTRTRVVIFEPTDPTQSHLTFDGEEYPVGKFALEVHPSLFSLLTL